MARTVAQINQNILDTLVPSMAAIGITIDTTKWSKRNIMRVIVFCVASAIAILEQLQGVLKTEIESIIASGSAASPKWIQDKMFKFQYSATDPQIIQLIDTIPVYPVVNANLRIITACSVSSNQSNVVSIKVAKSNPFVALSGLELAAAQGYINTIGMAGIIYSVVSLNADKLYVNADVYYQGQYASVIQANVISSINAYLQNLSITSFDGSLKMSDLEGLIRNVEGVNDVVLKNVKGRADTDAFASGVDLIMNNQVLQRSWVTIAGYTVGETTVGFTLADSLNFIPG